MKRLQLHDQEAAQFRKLFEQERIDGLEGRLDVLEAFLQTENHVTVEELTAQLAAGGRRLAPEFVQETLELMRRFGFADKRRFDDGQLRYEHRHLGHHHDHLVCTKCRDIVEFHDERLERLQAEIAAAHGFQLFQHKMELYGICSRCRDERRQLMPLTAAKTGERVVIRELAGGAGARARLLAMGLRIGDRLEIISNQGAGQVAVAADLKRFVLGQGLAQKVIVASAENGR